MLITRYVIKLVFNNGKCNVQTRNKIGTINKQKTRPL